MSWGPTRSQQTRALLPLSKITPVSPDQLWGSGCHCGHLQQCSRPVDGGEVKGCRVQELIEGEKQELKWHRKGLTVGYRWCAIGHGGRRSS